MPASANPTSERTYLATDHTLERIAEKLLRPLKPQFKVCQYTALILNNLLIAGEFQVFSH